MMSFSSSSSSSSSKYQNTFPNIHMYLTCIQGCGSAFIFCGSGSSSQSWSGSSFFLMRIRNQRENECGSSRIQIHSPPCIVKLSTEEIKNVLPEVPPDLALDGRYVAHEQLEEGGLAHPVGPHDGHSGVHVNTKLNILEQRWLGRVVEARKK